MFKVNNKDTRTTPMPVEWVGDRGGAVWRIWPTLYVKAGMTPEPVMILT